MYIFWTYCASNSINSLLNMLHTVIQPHHALLVIKILSGLNIVILGKCNLHIPRKSVTRFHFKNLQPDIHMFAGIQTDSDATRDKFSQNNALQITSNYLNILYKIIVLVRHEGYTGTDRRLEWFSIIRKACLISKTC